MSCPFRPQAHERARHAWSTSESGLPGSGEGNHVIRALAEFHRLQMAQRLRLEVVPHLAAEAAAVFLEQHRESGHYLSDSVALLCELASLEDPALARIGVHGLFPLLVEPLGDAFTPEACGLYNQL